MKKDRNILMVFFPVMAAILISCNAQEKSKGISEFPFFKQRNPSECGPVCLKMIFEHYGKSYPIDSLNIITNNQSNGTSLLNLSDAAESLGFNTLAVKATFAQLNNAPLPCIIHWQDSYFMVVYRISGDKIFIADPGDSLRVYSKDKFLSGWIKPRQYDGNMGVALMIQKEKIDLE